MPGHPGTSTRAANAAALWDRLRRARVSSVTDLARAAGTSRPTASAVLADLEDQGLVVSQDLVGPAPGRPATGWSLSPCAGYVLGADVLVSSVLVSAATLDGTVVAARTSPLSGEQRYPDLLAALTQEVDRLSGYGPLRHLSVSTTGIPDDAGVVLHADLVPQWNGFDLAGNLRHDLGVAVDVDNDINMAALGEFRLRVQDGQIAAQGDLLYILVARGIHSGLVLSGRVHRGSRFTAGEISAALDLRLEDAQAPDEDWVERVALTISSVGLVVDPDLIVISTPTARARSIVLPLMSLMRAKGTQWSPRLRVESAHLGWAAAAVGTLSLALDHANQAVTGADEVPVTPLEGVETVSNAATTGEHSTMTATAATSRPSDTLRVGVVGVGARAKFTLAAERPENNGRITAVCETHPRARERVASRLQRDPDSVSITTSVTDLVGTGIDVAFVTSPDDTHADVTCELLRAGVPVYLEKPLAITMEGATRVLRTAYETGTRLYVGHNMRHMHVVRSMRELIRSGRIGEVKAIWCRHFVGSGGDFYFKDWHATREHGTGLLLQKAAHDIDVMHWLADSHTTSVVAMGGQTLYHQVTDRADRSNELMHSWYSLDNWPPLSQKGLSPVIDVEDLSMVLMRMDSGVYASYEQCHYTPDYWRNYTVIGTEGRIENFGDGEGGLIRLWNRRTHYNAEGDEVFPIVGDAGGHGDADVLTITEFMRFVREGTPTDTSPLGAWYAVAAGIQATESLRDGSTPRTIPDLPPEVVDYFTRNQVR